MFYDSSGNIVPRPYAIISFLNGTTLDEYIKKHGCYPTRIITQIAEGLARIHYSTFDRAALLNCNFNYKKDVPPVSVQIRKLLNDKAGKHLPDGQKERLIDLLDKRMIYLQKLSGIMYYLTGTLTYGNILVDENDRVWFIDFENALSAGWLHDIGKFFRRKDDDIQKYINQDVFRYFAEAYNSKAKYQLRTTGCCLRALLIFQGYFFSERG